MTSTVWRLRAPLLAGATASALALTGCGLVQDDEEIDIIVTESAPYQEPTEITQEQLEEEGYELNATYVIDINQPNQVVSSGEYDANFFQHLAYLDNFNEANDTEVEPLFSVYYPPAGLFSLEYDSLEDLPEGAEVNLPVDPSNNGRALQLLADAELIEIDESVPVVELSQNDIIDNPQNLEFIETDQQSGAQVLPDVDLGFAFVRLVAEADYDVDETMLHMEDADEEVRTAFTSVVAVGPEGVTDQQAEALQEAFQSEEVEEWFEEYQGGVIEYTDSITIDNADEVWADFTANGEDAE